MTKFFKPLMLPCALKKDPSLFQGMNAVYQFNLSGEEEGAYHVVMRPKNRYGLPAKSRESLYSWQKQLIDSIHQDRHSFAGFFAIM